MTAALKGTRWRRTKGGAIWTVTGAYSRGPGAGWLILTSENGGKVHEPRGIVEHEWLPVEDGAE